MPSSDNHEDTWYKSAWVEYLVNSLVDVLNQRIIQMKLGAGHTLPDTGGTDYLSQVNQTIRWLFSHDCNEEFNMLNDGLC